MEKIIKSYCPTCGSVFITNGWEKSDEILPADLPEEKCPECLLMDILAWTFSLPA